jgi:hypothetical protein
MTLKAVQHFTTTLSAAVEWILGLNQTSAAGD